MNTNGIKALFTSVSNNAFYHPQLENKQLQLIGLLLQEKRQSNAMLGASAIIFHY
jgi:hypothetical protein